MALAWLISVIHAGMSSCFKQFGFIFINIICDFVANSYMVSPRTHQQQQQQQQVYFKLSIVYKACAPINN